MYDKFHQLCEHLLEASADGVIVANEQQQIVLFSKGASRIFGYTETEMTGNSLGQLLPERFRKSHVGDVQAFGEGTENSRFMGSRGEVIGLHRDGSEMFIEASIVHFEIENERYFAAIVRDISGRKEREERIERSLEEKDVLLREIHHRVKNNLQIISSLLKLQSRKSLNQAALDAIAESQERIRAIALVHELLYQSETLSTVDMGRYFEQLVGMLMQSLTPGRKIRTLVHADAILMGVDAAIPCGLIVNELVTNALKHAFEPGVPGEVVIDLKPGAEDGSFVLTVKDNGVGIPQGSDILHGETLGVKLVTALARQLSGKIVFRRDAGTVVSLKFKPPVEQGQ